MSPNSASQANCTGSCPDSVPLFANWMDKKTTLLQPGLKTVSIAPVLRLKEREERKKWPLRASLFPSVILNRFQQEILKIEAEIHPWGCCAHLCLFNIPFRCEREGNVSICPQFAISPPCNKRIVLPVLKIADQGRGLCECNRK